MVEPLFLHIDFVQDWLDVQTSAFCIAVLWFGLYGILFGF